MKLRFSRKTLGIPYAVFLVCFVIIPMLVIVFYAFTDDEMHFSFVNFGKFFSDPHQAFDHRLFARHRAPDDRQSRSSSPIPSPTFWRAARCRRSISCSFSS